MTRFEIKKKQPRNTSQVCPINQTPVVLIHACVVHHDMLRINNMYLQILE